jgi:hypothetical protein
MSFRKDFVRLTLLVGVAAISYLSPAFCAAPAGFAGQWKLNAKESDDPGKKFEEAFQKKQQEDEGLTHHGKTFKPKGGPAGDKNGNPFEAPDTITIEPDADSVKVTDSKGNTRVYFTDGRKTEQDMGKGRTMTSRARWEDDAFIVQSQGPDGGTLTASYYLSQDGSQLYVKLQLRPVFIDQPVTIIRVYDPAPTQTQTQTQTQHR